ncbi:iron-sulfur cluster assembly scaffold protein [archaeon]|nr:iron-sulfur cluster assembly scaffold protein [archaeon]|tara:strand:- start:604 stop:972 length:369 start_codon:yes stop_codon:yes gene_type:complete
MYTDEVLRRFKDPKYMGKIENANGIGKVGNPQCGDLMHVYIRVEDDKIVDISFETFGCVSALAASDALCELADGVSIEEAKKISDKDIADKLGGLPPIKHHCSILGSQALKDAIADYEGKKN